MRIKLALSLVAVALLFAGPVRAGEPSTAAHEFHVTGMTCALCAKAIEKGLRSVDGVHEVRIDREAERVRVTASNHVSRGALEAAIEGAGSYRADLVGPGSNESEVR
jgi:copper chaperone CopZ